MKVGKDAVAAKSAAEEEARRQAEEERRREEENARLEAERAQQEAVNKQMAAIMGGPVPATPSDPKGDDDETKADESGTEQQATLSIPQAISLPTR